VDRCRELEVHYNCLIVVVHHLGKDPSKGGRGSNALNAAADVTLQVDKLSAHSRVRIIEMKDGPEGLEWTFRLVPRVPADVANTFAETCADASTCVVQILSEPGQPKPSVRKAEKLPTGVADDLLKIILHAIAEAGEASIVAPKGVAVSRDNLGKYCLAGAWQDKEGKPDSFRSMLSKYLERLRSMGLIDVYQEWVWLK